VESHKEKTASYWNDATASKGMTTVKGKKKEEARKASLLEPS
jgi:hypothetical protein